MSIDDDDNNDSKIYEKNNSCCPRFIHVGSIGTLNWFEFFPFATLTYQDNQMSFHKLLFFSLNLLHSSCFYEFEMARCRHLWNTKMIIEINLLAASQNLPRIGLKIWGQQSQVLPHSCVLLPSLLWLSTINVNYKHHMTRPRARNPVENREDFTRSLLYPTKE